MLVAEPGWATLSIFGALANNKYLAIVTESHAQHRKNPYIAYGFRIPDCLTLGWGGGRRCGSGRRDIHV